MDDLTREFVISAHGNFDKVKSILADHAELINVVFQWGEDNFETPVQAAAHVGNVAIAEYLLEHGATYDIIVAATLGRKDDVAKFLAEDAVHAKAVGGHNIPLMIHAAYSGDTSIAQMIYDQGGTEGMNSALFSATSKGHKGMVQWLLEHGADDLNGKNFQDKTVLQVATELGYEEIAALLRQHGAGE